MDVVAVHVDEHDTLPHPEDHAAVDHGQDDRGRHQNGKKVVRSVAPRTMPVEIVRVAGQEPFERGYQVLLGSRAGLHQGNPRCGMRHKYRAEPVAPAGTELLHLAGQVDHFPARGVESDLRRSHTPHLPGDFVGRWDVPAAHVQNPIP